MSFYLPFRFKGMRHSLLTKRIRISTEEEEKQNFIHSDNLSPILAKRSKLQQVDTRSVPHIFFVKKLEVESNLKEEFLRT